MLFHQFKKILRILMRRLGTRYGILQRLLTRKQPITEGLNDNVTNLKNL